MADIARPGAQSTTATSYIEWGAVFAGAVIAAALSFVLLTFGTSIGLSFVSPWPGASAPAWLVASLAVFWTMAQYIASFMVGGYVAGRLRTARAGASADETEFRDGLHGGLVWAIGIIIGAALAATAAGLLTRAASDMAGRAGAGAAATQAVDPNAYAVDLILRPTGPGRPAGAAGQTPYPELRGEMTRTVARAMARGSLSDADRTYLAAVAADRTGLSQQDAERRVTESFTEASRTSREAADTARRGAITTGLITAISLLVGLGAAWWAAIRGGQHRDQSIPARFVIGRHPPA